MAAATYITFYLGIACLAVGGASALLYLRDTTENSALQAARGAVFAGAVCLVLMLCCQFATWGLVPFTNKVDVLSLFLALTAILSILLARRPTRRPLMVFYAPVLVLMALVALAVAPGDLGRPPRELSNLLLMLHVGMVFLSYSLFSMASITSGAYVFQARRLKARRTAGLFQKLPSLEELDSTLFQLIRLGYPAFVATMALGIFWAWYDRQLLSSSWWLSPKVLLSLGILLFYAYSYHGRARGLLRGTKLAHTVFYGFSLLLGLSLLLKLLSLSSYNFWGAGA